MILEQCKGVHCVDLDESFQTHIYLQNFVSIQLRTSPVKFAASVGPNHLFRQEVDQSRIVVEEPRYKI